MVASIVVQERKSSEQDFSIEYGSGFMERNDFLMYMSCSLVEFPFVLTLLVSYLIQKTMLFWKKVPRSSS